MAPKGAAIVDLGMYGLTGGQRMTVGWVKSSRVVVPSRVGVLR